MKGFGEAERHTDRLMQPSSVAELLLVTNTDEVKTHSRQQKIVVRKGNIPHAPLTQCAIVVLFDSRSFLYSISP